MAAARMVLGLAMVALACSGAAAATAERLMLRSEILGEYRPINVVLPEKYDERRFYPVVIVLDGERKFLAEAVDMMHLAEPDLIVVGVENVDRARDMFPERLQAQDGRGGGARDFLEFLAEELIPYVEGKYAASGIRILTGQSNSGFFVLYAMFQRPYAFNAWIAGSPMIDWDRVRIFDGMSDLFAARPDFEGALYMNRGGDDYERVTAAWDDFIDLLDATAPKGFRWRADILEAAGHVPMEAYRDGIGFVLGND